MGLSNKQIADLKSLRKLNSQARATTNDKIRHKLKNELDGLNDIEFMLSHLPRDHAKRAVSDKHIAKAMKILLSLLDLREFKRVRQNSPGEDGYVIKEHRGKYKRTPLTQKEFSRYLAMYNFYINYMKYFNPRVVLPGDSSILDISPTYAPNDWVYFDDGVDYHIHVQQTYGPLIKPLYDMSGPRGKRIKEIEIALFDPNMDSNTKSKLAAEHIQLSSQIIRASSKNDLPIAESEAELEKLSQEAIQRNIEATNEWIEFFKSTH